MPPYRPEPTTREELEARIAEYDEAGRARTMEGLINRTLAQSWRWEMEERFPINNKRP